MKGEQLATVGIMLLATVAATFDQRELFGAASIQPSQTDTASLPQAPAGSPSGSSPARKFPGTYDFVYLFKNLGVRGVSIHEMYTVGADSNVYMESNGNIVEIKLDGLKPKSANVGRLIRNLQEPLLAIPPLPLEYLTKSLLNLINNRHSFIIYCKEGNVGFTEGNCNKNWHATLGYCFKVESEPVYAELVKIVMDAIIHL